MFSGPRVEAMHARLKQVADDFGLPFTPSMHAPNTKKALAISEHARRVGRLSEWREAAMNAYWRDARDIEDDAVLAELLEQAGLDVAAAMSFLKQPEVPALLRAQREEAARWGVTGIPTWFMLPRGWSPSDPLPESGPKPVRVVGCQPMDVVERAAKMAGAALRPGR